MPGPTRRSKPLRGTVLIGDFKDFTITNAAEGDLLGFDANTSSWLNTKALTGDYAITGTWQATDIIVDDDLTVADDASIGGNLSVTGTSALTGNVTVSGTTNVQALTVAGAATLQSTANITGLLTGAGFSFSGNGTIAGTLGVTGLSTLGTANITTLAVSGNSDLTGYLHVIGLGVFDDNVSMGAGLSVTSGVSAASLTGVNITASGTMKVGTILSSLINRWQIDGTNDTDVFVDNLLTSGRWLFTGLNSAEAEQTLLTLDPDDATLIYHAGTLGAGTYSDGLFIRDTSVSNLPTLLFENQAGTDLATIGVTSTGDSLDLFNLIVSGWVRIRATDAASASKKLFKGDPDGSTELYFAGTKEFETKSSGVIITNELEIDGALNHDGSTVGFYGTAPTTLQTGVAVTAAGIHAALVTLGLITA